MQTWSKAVLKFLIIFFVSPLTTALICIFREGLSGSFLTSLLQLSVQQNSATAPCSQPDREHSAHSVLQSLRSGSAELFSAHLEMPSAFLHWGMDASRVVCDTFTLTPEQYTNTKST
jgi:hypothetical protein